MKSNNDEWKGYIGADGRTFAERVKDLLVIAKLNQTELARKTGISAANMSNYLQTDTNKKVTEPTALNISKIANALGVSCGYLITGVQRVGEDIVTKQEVLDQLSRTLTLISYGLENRMSDYFNEIINEMIRLVVVRNAIHKPKEREVKEV